MNIPPKIRRAQQGRAAQGGRNDLKPPAFPLPEAFSPSQCSLPPLRILHFSPVSSRIPRFWVEVNDGSPIPSAASPQSAVWRRRNQVDSWALTCSALNIPWRVDGKGLRRILYVPALYGQMAREQLAEISSERPPAEEASPPRRKNAHLALGLFLPLLVWHGITHHWWLAWGPSGQQWEALGALRADRVLNGELYRAVTALTLHTDSVHLFGNILFGAPFFILLCSRIGAGAAMLLTLFAGAGANICEALYRHNASTSLGFSTALFAVVGLHAAFLAMDEIRLIKKTRPASLRRGLKKSFVLLACGGAILAALGTDPSPKNDYAAHIFGLLSGLITGFAAAALGGNIKDSPARQALCGAAAFCLASGAWIWAVISGS